MGALAMARRDTATSRKVERDDLGWTFAEPLEQRVADFIAHLDASTYERKQRHLAGMSRSQFLDLTDTRDLVQRLESLAASGVKTPARAACARAIRTARCPQLPR